MGENVYLITVPRKVPYRITIASVIFLAAFAYDVVILNGGCSRNLNEQEIMTEGNEKYIVMMKQIKGDQIVCKINEGSV